MRTLESLLNSPVDIHYASDVHYALCSLAVDLTERWLVAISALRLDAVGTAPV